MLLISAVDCSACGGSGEIVQGPPPTLEEYEAITVHAGNGTDPSVRFDSYPGRPGALTFDMLRNALIMTMCANGFTNPAHPDWEFHHADSGPHGHDWIPDNNYPKVRITLPKRVQFAIASNKVTGRRFLAAIAGTDVIVCYI